MAPVSAMSLASLLLLAWLAPCVTPQAVPELSRSLRCYNDYSSHIRCQWRESRAAHRLAPMSLYHWNHINMSEQQCVPTAAPQHLSGEELGWECRLPISTFGIGVTDILQFRLARAAGSSTALSLLSQPVRPPPPRRLRCRLTEEGGARLSWDTGYPDAGEPGGRLEFHVRYRRAPRDWEEAEVTGTQLALAAGDLAPGSRYEAQVRARAVAGGGRRGRWSEWSPPEAWQTKDRGDWGPYSLRCDFDGLGEVTCTWDVKREVTSSVTFLLAYRTSATAREQWCRPEAVTVPPSDPLLAYRCRFPAHDSSELQVDLRPEEISREFASSQSIQPSVPWNLTVEESGDGFHLRWKGSDPDYESVSFVSEVRYWRDAGDKEMKTQRLIEGVRTLSFPTSTLSPSSAYCAQVRMGLDPEDSGCGACYEPGSAQLREGVEPTGAACRGCYAGPWSDWSPPVQWKTKPDTSLSPTSIYVILPVGVVAVAVFLYCLFRQANRRLIVWEVSIPSPLKSKVLKEAMWKYPGAYLIPQKDFDRTCISTVQVLEKEKEQPLCSTKSADGPRKADRTPELTKSGPYQHATWAQDFGTGPILQQGHESPALNFCGPYILCPQSSSSSSSSSSSPSDYMPFDSPAGAPPSGSLLPDASQGYVEVPVAFQSGPAAPRPPREESEGYPQVPPAGPPTGALPMDPPPAYSPSPFAPPPAEGSALLLKQVGDYCFLPDPSGKDWDTADTPGCPSTQKAGPPGKAAQGKAQALALIGDSPYVRLAQPGCREQDWGPLELWGAPPVETGPKGRRILPERTGRTPAGGGREEPPPPCPTLPMSSGPPLH